MGSSDGPPDLDSIVFWLNAFIPSSVCELKGDLYVINIPMPQGLPLPLPRYFTGDQREFSNRPTASSRMHSEARLEAISSDAPRLAYQRQVCGESHEVDGDGKVIASATAGTDEMSFFNLRGSQTTDPEGGVIDGIPGSIQLDLAGSASIPLLGLAPAIKYSGTLMIDRAEGNILFKGAITGFPAFEIYYCVNDGPILTLAQIDPISPLELFWENRAVDVHARIVT